MTSGRVQGPDQGESQRVIIFLSKKGSCCWQVLSRRAPHVTFVKDPSGCRLRADYRVGRGNKTSSETTARGR
jgi:hypothetical protein